MLSVRSSVIQSKKADNLAIIKTWLKLTHSSKAKLKFEKPKKNELLRDWIGQGLL